MNALDRANKTQKIYSRSWRFDSRNRLLLGPTLDKLYVRELVEALDVVIKGHGSKEATWVEGCTRTFLKCSKQW